MIPIDILLAFIPTAFVLIISPGPDSIYTLTRSISDGRTAGVSAALGTSTGSLVHTTAAVLGLSAVLNTSAVAYTVVKLVGAAYLVVLGVQTFRSDDAFDITAERSSQPPFSSFKSALLINVLNPKVAVFFLAFLPQFVQPGGSTAIQLFLFGVLFATLGFCYQALLAVFSAQARQLLIDAERFQKLLQAGSASVLVAFGIKLAVDRRIAS